MGYIRKRKTAKGEARYIAEVRIKGAKPSTKTFSRKTDAEAWARNERDKLKRVAAGIARQEIHTLAEAIERFLEERAHTCRDLVAASSALNWWKKELGPRPLFTIQPSEILALRNKLAAEPKHGGKPGYKGNAPLYDASGAPVLRAAKTVQTYVDYLSNLYNKAKLEWNWVETNPAKSVKKLKISNERTRFLSDYLHLWPGEDIPCHWNELSHEQKNIAAKMFPREYELPRLIQAIKDYADAARANAYNPHWTKCLFTIQLGAGLRLAEASHMVWEENTVIKHPIVIVDLQREVLTLKSTKSDKKARLKPLSKESVNVLKQLYAERTSSSPLVFPSPSNGERPLDFAKRIERVIEISGLQDFRWHDLRHTTASYLAMMGAGPKEIMDSLHHRSMRSSERYQHLSQTHLRGLMQRLSKTISQDAESPSRFEGEQSA